MDPISFPNEGLALAFPFAPQTVPAPSHFVVCPMALCQQTHGWVYEAYQRAYEQAKAAVSPPWYERFLIASPN